MVGQINRTAFELFGLQIYWYAIIIVSGIAIALWLANREALRVGLKEDDMTNFLLWALPIAIIGARLYYVLFDLPMYLADPIQIFNTRSGGLAIYGGLIAAVLVLIVYTRHHFIDPWLFLDVVSPGVMLAQAMGRWGNFTNHEAFGGETTRQFLESIHLPQFIINNMYIDGAFRQPTFFYESMWSLAGFILILFIRKNVSLKRGELFLGYVTWYSFGRFFIEGMRTDSLYAFGGIRVSQLLSVVLFVGGIALLYYRRKKSTNIKLYERDKGANQALI
ncbi:MULTISPECIES: prolipoprotein diacylglyceryl transferase [Enterococcus]|uniref:Phosphatidylglycerol--prolipoprotein diacylglyceryl transferase n=1 Tax=Enterococcus malodoratus ATCC 43197 TaxID=1158601 RepID=R2RKH0_9ENTE|nr:MULTISPECIES: prolipoprotein diacylglyceryl transferase [Enterococcus]BBM19191.1 prolipoprotein diacylglyceryl transferase [Enterococcus avium]EOH81141.1 prolipoprotein diacylglyceryl transferase [Enterococcus malodoratus ATCC 43197]EOT69651.1 prolipoprotein diacylglyceryl transferase [Enterococcus malodoratus ATCC 43197]OJG60358.1 prolipoprotein diacylglyceryl transferase [Enterococcus malodoratus]SPX01290.1 prolipoprotein diacylglyceryl transferase [Enterococcus malodoratus]